MKITFYYILLFIGVVLIASYGVFDTHDSMSMTQVLSLCGFLALYTLALSLVGEGKAADERAETHRYLSNRTALVVSTVVISLGIIVQLFVTHQLDFWLLGSLIVLNLSKIISLIYLNYKK